MHYWRRWLSAFRRVRARELLAGFGLCLALALALRLWVISSLSAQAFGCRLCVVPDVAAADMPYLAVSFTLFALSVVGQSWLWRLVWRGLGLAALWVYAIDVAVMAQFSTRLMLADVSVYTADPLLAAGLAFSLPFWQQAAAVLVLLVTLWLLGVPLRKRLVARRAVPALALLVGVSMLVFWLWPFASYVHQWALGNVVQANLPTGIATPYSEPARERLENTLPVRQCYPGAHARKHVVMLVLESWSTYHSRRWLAESGHNWTPRIDALAGQGRWFSQLYAGGHTTNKGLTSLLAGKEMRLPVLPADQIESFAGGWNGSTSLPQQLADVGYQSVLLTSGDLGYTRKGEWLKHIGFDRVSGNEAEVYAGIKRHKFGGVADSVLYAHARDVVGEQREAGVPTFTVVENVSTHQPYAQPETGEQSEEAVFRYMDNTVADFIEGLRDDGFMDDSVLIVVSDHRAMTFETAAEHQVFGPSAAARIPGFILADGIASGEVSEPTHQADMMFTVMDQASDEVCGRRGQRSLLSEHELTPRCLLHARGDERDKVDVFCADGYGRVRVEGDNSRFVHASGLSAQKQRRVLDDIARERLEMVP